MASFTFLYTNNDSNDISARILRKALENGTL
jgi:hypothetical protein